MWVFGRGGWYLGGYIIRATAMQEGGYVGVAQGLRAWWLLLQASETDRESVPQPICDRIREGRRTSKSRNSSKPFWWQIAPCPSLPSPPFSPFPLFRPLPPPP